VTKCLVKPLQLGESCLGQAPVVAVKGALQAAALVRLIHGEPGALGPAEQRLGRPLGYAEVVGDLAGGMSATQAERFQEREPVRHGSERSWPLSGAEALTVPAGARRDTGKPYQRRRSHLQQVL
jgi:hypothetical protein